MLEPTEPTTPSEVIRGVRSGDLVVVKRSVFREW